MANEIKKVNVDGITYDLGGGGGAGQELISQDDITFNEYIDENDFYYVEIADEDINNKYVNIVLDEVLTKFKEGCDWPLFKFNNPKNATITFISTGDNHLEGIQFIYNTFLKGYTIDDANQEIYGMGNYWGETENSITFQYVTGALITLKFDAFGFLTIHSTLSNREV